MAAAGMRASVLFWTLRWRERAAGEIVPGLRWGTLIDVLIVFASLAVPTILLESSSETWGPGTRWPMIYQVTTPARITGDDFDYGLVDFTHSAILDFAVLEWGGRADRRRSECCFRSGTTGCRMRLSATRHLYVKV